MDILTLERRAVMAIAWITIVTGAVQLLMPDRLLPVLGVEPNQVSSQLFAMIGMFMVLFGAATAQAITHREAAQVVLLWSGWQKIGASLLVAWAVSKGVFTPPALLLASFDFTSGLLFFHLRKQG